jgi:hypothetical protein
MQTKGPEMGKMGVDIRVLHKELDCGRRAGGVMMTPIGYVLLRFAILSVDH